MNHTLTKRIEALLFAWGDALSYQKLGQLLKADGASIRAAVAELQEHYAADNHGIHLIEVNQSVQLASKSDLAADIEQLFESSRTRGLSASLLEVLSIIAYRQPITKIEIETIRGVRSDRSIQSLVELDLVRVAGSLEQVGRPNLYATTDLFLKKFGIKNLRELPAVESFERLQITLDDQGAATNYGHTQEITS